MIGVITRKHERPIIYEFFELFKTPWEFYKDNGTYNAIIITTEEVPDVSASLIIVFGSNLTGYDFDNGIESCSGLKGALCEFKGYGFPIYGECLNFSEKHKSLIKIQNATESIAIDINLEERRVLRIGYDFFKEIHFLLTDGQPAEFAMIPTLEIHISILRKLVLLSGAPLMEIPPIPAGFSFMACLTHDVDFVGIRRHKFDQTFFGFLYRALVLTLVNVLKGITSWRKMYKNFNAVLSLPLIYLGLKKDFMILFEKYLQIEKDYASTFYIMPYKHQPGKDSPERSSKGRATKYDIDDIISEVKHLYSNGCEIGLHGIDAWCDVEKGRLELERIAEVTGDTDIGIRMHWLYYSSDTPLLLEKAGFSYDSTSGYNEAIGYRAGSTQVFLPPGAEHLLVIPLHLMDTALFTADRLNLTETEALMRAKDLFEVTEQFGGVLTINWHHRSIGPERLWDYFYADLLQELRARKVWFGTARDVVRWFRKRRTVNFVSTSFVGNQIRIQLASEEDSLPALVLRVHKPYEEMEFGDTTQYQENYVDKQFTGNKVLTVTM